MRKQGVALVIVCGTLLLVLIAWLQSGGWQLRKNANAITPEEAVRALMTDIQARDWDRAYAQLDRKNDVDKSAFVRDVAGSDGSLRSYASLQSYDLSSLRAEQDAAAVRTHVVWSTAVGSLETFWDLNLQREGSRWRVVWPKPTVNDVPPQVVPVNYLRWDLIGRNSSQVWGNQSVDAPQGRITSMNAVDRSDRVTVLGEIENQDTVPAYVNVNATLLAADGSPIDEEGSFDLISHILLPKQVAPYRIDFPGIRLAAVKSVRMDARPLLVPASADPVIAVVSQSIGKDNIGRTALMGDLVNQSGQLVNIAQVIAAFYDATGKVIWVSGGYVDRALLPQVRTSFALDIPNDVLSQMKTYHVTVNHFTRTSN